MKTNIQKFTVEEMISALLAAAKASSQGLNARIRMQDWEWNFENVITLQVENDTNGDVLIRFDPNEIPRPAGWHGAETLHSQD